MTNEDMKLIKRMTKVAKEFKDLYNNWENGFVALNASLNDPKASVQLTDGKFFQMFTDKSKIQMRKLTDVTYPYRYSTIFGDVEFSCISTVNHFDSEVDK